MLITAGASRFRYALLHPYQAKHCVEHPPHLPSLSHASRSPAPVDLSALPIHLSDKSLLSLRLALGMQMLYGLPTLWGGTLSDSYDRVIARFSTGKIILIRRLLHHR